MDRDFLVSCVKRGMTTKEISQESNKTPKTVRYWLKKYNLKAKNTTHNNGVRQKVDKDNQNCLCCGVKLTIENAHYRKKLDIYYSLCKECRAYEGFQQRFNFKTKAVDYKGGSCQKCGYNKDLTALEFHHLDPSQKEINPTKLYYKPWELTKKELDKCVVLCSNCHREEHSIINKKKKQEKEFLSNLTNNFSDSILTGKNTGQNSCNQCDKVLTEENTSSGSHKYICKSCDSKNVVERGIKGKEKAVEYMGGCCSVCGYDDCINALEFHHIDPSKKSPTYHKRFCYWGFERQKEELENCIIVCSNCHREIHSKEDWKTDV